MITERAYPLYILPEELDDYLAKGWYRMGQSIFTCHFLWFGKVLYSPIWLRLNLNEYKSGKRQRKLMRKNEAKFTTGYRRIKLTQEKEKLFQKYRLNFKGNLSSSLKQSLQDGSDFNIFNTYEACVYHENKLVAFSFFDVGGKSLASISGVYDPDYSEYSLGFYTMLLEMKLGLDNKLTYYYPGYVVPGYSRFDYKMRIGTVEYYDVQDHQWYPLDEQNMPQTPLELLEDKMEEVRKAADEIELPCQICYYPLFEANLFGFWKESYLESPIFMWCFPKNIGTQHLFICYDIPSGNFQLIQCHNVERHSFQLSMRKQFDQMKGQRPLYEELLIKEKLLLESRDVHIIIKTLNSKKQQWWSSNLKF